MQPDVIKTLSKIWYNVSAESLNTAFSVFNNECKKELFAWKVF